MRILYISRSNDPVDRVYIGGLKENGVEVLSLRLKINIHDLLGLARLYRKNRKNLDLIMVGWDSPGLVIFAYLISDKKIIYNAALSVYERLIVSRELASMFSIKAFYYWLLDFVAVHLADLTMVETNHQAGYFKKIFKVSEKKIHSAWTGVDGDEFFYDSTIVKFDIFTVLFRGALMPEAGAEYVVRAAKILENQNVKFIIIGGGILLEKTRKFVNELKPVNLELITDFVPYDKLRIIMQKCHLLLGQLSGHDRLTRTIPHKAYESLAMKLPYLTASSTGILELLKAGETCITCKPASAESLAEKIIWAKNNPGELERIAQNGYRLYQDKLQSRILAKNLLDRMADVLRVAS